MRVAASKVKGGDTIHTSAGEIAHVLSSNPERQSAASASFGLWHIEYYTEGRPTYRMLVGPDDLVDVVERG